jgi:prepilin-type N-terminal cleavage/methylation domain-containing protein
MPKIPALGVVTHKKQLASFTLIELLTVIAIIAILAALVLYAGSGALNEAARKRAASEIQAISTALENYKTDNGIYPNTNVATGFGMANSILLTNSAATPYFSTSLDGTGPDYQKGSQLLYLNLTGMTNFSDVPATGVKSYMSLKRSQVGDASGGSYVKDPWNYSYGYSTGNGTTSFPYNGNGFFDLWSTGGTLSGNANTNTWISNWQ